MEKIPATIVTGFLGSGKTTLLNQLLADRPLEKIAVIVNEFGEVGIDGQLVMGTEETIVELNNGCICCTVRGDLISAIDRILSSGRVLDRFVIETTGLADPAPVIQSFMLDEMLRTNLVLDAIITVVDAEYVGIELEHEEAREQIAFADVILLNKIDRVEDVAAIEALLRQLNPLARIHRTQRCGIDVAQILNIGAFDLRNVLRIDPQILTDTDHEHDSRIAGVAIRMPGAVDGTLLNRWLNGLVQEQGVDLLRFKGIVHLADEKRRFVFHGVHMTYEGAPGRAWQHDEPGNEMVFIGRNLDADGLSRGFEACLVAMGAVAA